jgi:rubrerythrin
MSKGDHVPTGTPDNNIGGISLKDQTILEKCREIELLSRDLYTCFAKTYVDSDEAVRLWHKTAREEQNHADQFSLALKLRKGLQIRTGISQEKADDIIKKLQITINKVTQTPLPLIKALDFAVRLEHLLAELHLSCIAEFSDPSFQSLFNAMMSSDQEHIASLETLLTKITNGTSSETNAITGQKSEAAPHLPVGTSGLEPYQQKILDLLKEQELLMGSIYQKNAELFPDNADSYHAFMDEEMEHAVWIEQLHKACISGKASFSEGKTRSYTVSNMITYLREFYKRLETGSLTELQALTAMADFEKALIERNIFQHFNGDSPEVVKTLTLLNGIQKEHTDCITKLLQQVRESQITTY